MEIVTMVWFNLVDRGQKPVEKPAAHQDIDFVELDGIFMAGKPL